MEDALWGCRGGLSIHVRVSDCGWRYLSTGCMVGRDNGRGLWKVATSWF